MKRHKWEHRPDTELVARWCAHCSYGPEHGIHYQEDEMKYTVTLKVPFEYDGDSDNLVGIALAYVLDAIAEQPSGGLPDSVGIKIKKVKASHEPG